MRNDRLEHRADVLRGWYHQLNGGQGPLPNEADLEARMRGELAARGRPVTLAGPAVVFVNDSRWVVECNCQCGEECRAGVACSPGMDHAICLLCGCQFDLVWPDEATMQRVEATLIERPPRLPRDLDAKGMLTTRCWRPGEDVARLEAETATLKAALAARGRR